MHTLGPSRPKKFAYRRKTQDILDVEIGTQVIRRLE